MANSRSQEKSWTVGDLVKKSELISEGTPARYRLLTTRSNLDESGKIRKWTFGQRDINTQTKIILLVGETGAGKTSLINAIVNYTLGVKFEDHVWFEITEDALTEDQTETQTTEITVYEVFFQNNLSVTIIDTPGYGDTRGAAHDKMIADNLLKLFENDTGVKEIDAVGLVVKGSENRLSDRQHYIFDAVLSLFGKDVEENIVILVTHSNGTHPKNVISAIKKMNVPCKKKNGTDPVYFLFDNCQAEEQMEEEQTDDKEKEEKKEDKKEEVYKRAWKLTEKSLKNVFTSLEIQNRKSLMKTKNVLIEQIQLKACVSNLCQNIEIKESQQDELTQIQKALKDNQEKIQRNEDFSFTIIRKRMKKVTIENASWWNEKATCCSVCEQNCHESNCWCAINPKWCWVMKNEHCTVCTGKCHHSNHIRENKKYIMNSEEVTMMFSDLTKQYESTEEDSENRASIDNTLKAELTKAYKEKTRLVEEAYTTIMKLSEITLKPDSAFLVETLDFLIPRAEKAGRSDWVQKLEELRKIEPEAQRRVTAALSYVGTYLVKGITSLIPKK